MRESRRQIALGAGVLLGSLLGALTLEAPQAETGTCEATAVYEPVVVGVCTQPPRPEPPPAPELPSAPEPPSEPDPPPSALAQLLLVTDVGVVLSAEAATGWGAGPLYEPPGRSTYRVAKRAALEQLPAEFAAWRGRAFDLFGAEGKVCSARLGELHIVSQYAGYGLEGVLGEGWDEDALCDRFDHKDVPAELWREQLWDADSRWLVAEYVAEGDCEGALWARDAALPPPTVLKASAGPHPVADARLAAFERSEKLAQMRRDYEEWYEHRLSDDQRPFEDSWEETSAEHPASVRLWTEGDAVRMVELDFGTWLCGPGRETRVTKYERVEHGEFIDTELPADVLAIFDADLDGRWEYIFEEPWPTGPISWREVISETEALAWKLVVHADWSPQC